MANYTSQDIHRKLQNLKEEPYVSDRNAELLEEIAEAQYERDEKTYFFDVWRNIEEAALAAWREDDYELYDYLKNNWEIMKLHAEQSGE